MPSGAKKRKAAKKKKEQEATNNNNNSSSSTNNNNNSNPLGNDDPKSQDERESDGGEVGSPASQDNQNHQHPFEVRSEESEKRDPSPGRSLDTENKSMDEFAGDIEGTKKIIIEDDDAIKAQRELKSEEDLESQSISIKHIEFVKESHDGSSSSSSSSSDDESQVVEKKSEEAAYDSISEATSQNGENKPVDSLSEQLIQGTEKSSFEEADKSDVDIVTIDDSVKPLVTVIEEVIPVAQSDSIENSSVPDVVETRLNESEVSKKNDEKVFPIVEDNVGTLSTVVESVASGSEGKVLPTSDALIAETSNGAENIRDSKILDSSGNQPLIAPAPRVAERTSWMSCCGLLDVLTGSSR